MKKTTLFLLLILISSCATSGRVCGGKGGQRCVKIITHHSKESKFC
jgi:hypothetical protein